jgi:telomerase protein component 1
MSTAWKTVRVFISSTFRDMQAERDHLVRFVFPKLREELVKWRVHFEDVDLRWGVTSDQDALHVCREVIDECRPRFMCMLGGRYGYVPPGGDHSITADEVRYGVLDRLSERGYAFFYFRDGRATARSIGERPGDFREARGSHSAQKLAALKRAIKRAGLQPFSYHAKWDAAQRRFTGLETFGNRVYADLLQSCKDDPALAPRFANEGATPPDEFAEEAEQMEAFIEERSQPERFILGSRQPLLDAMLAFAAADGVPNLFVLTGEPGSGKSAFLARFTRELAAQPFDNRHSSLVIPHFIGASAGSTDLRRTLRRLCHDIALAAANTEPLPLDIKDLINHFQKLLTDASANKRVILVFDALNQLDATEGAHWLNWLPRELPPGVRILASVIAPAEGQPEHQTLAILRTRPGTRIVKLQSLGRKDVGAIIEGYLKRYAKQLGRDQLALLLRKRDRRLPLYVLTALEELRTLGTYEEITDRIRDLPGDARALFGWILTERLARDPGFRDGEGRSCGGALVEKFAACLGVSRHGLSPAELTALLDPGDPLGNVAALLRLLRPYLMRRGELLDFYHGQFREAAGAAHLDTPEKQRAAHQSVATCLQAFADPDRDGQCRDATPHALGELPHHQTRAEAWPDLITTLENIFFLEAKVTHGMAFDLAEDFTVAADALPTTHVERRRLRLLGEALRRDLHFIARNAQVYPQGLFQCLWNSCWWYDSPKASGHYETAFVVPHDGQTLYALLEDWHLVRDAGLTSSPWIRSLRPPPSRLGGGQVLQLPGHGVFHNSISVSSDGAHIASGGEDHSVRIWNATTGEHVTTFEGHECPIQAVSFVADGTLVASGSSDSIRFWHASTGQEDFFLPKQDRSMRTIAFSQDGCRVAFSCGGGVGVVYDRRTRAATEFFDDATIYGFSALCFSPEGDWLVCASSFKHVLLWNIETDESLQLDGCRAAQSAAFSQDGHLIVIGSADKTASIWETHTGRRLGTLSGHEHMVTDAAFSPDGTLVVTGSFDGSVRVWSIATREQKVVLRGHAYGVNSVAFHPDGLRVVSGAADGTIRVWNIADATELPTLRGQYDSMRLLAFSTSGRRLATTDKAKKVRVWSAENGRELLVFEGNGNAVIAADFSPDEKRIAIGSSDGSVRIWDAEAGKELLSFRGDKTAALVLAFSPSGRVIASSSDKKEIRLWNAATGRLMRLLRGDADHVAFSSDERLLLGRGEESLCVWRVKNGAQLFTLRCAELVNASFSAEEETIVVELENGKVQVWDIRNGRRIHGSLAGANLSAQTSIVETGIVGGSSETPVVLLSIPLLNATLHLPTLTLAGSFGAYLGLFVLDNGGGTDIPPISADRLETRVCGLAQLS